MARRTQQQNDAPSPEALAEAEALARANQRPGQTKEQTKLVAQGIAKGIAAYKKQQKARAREQDKARKRRLREPSQDDGTERLEALPACAPSTPTWRAALPWVLLVASWAFFALYCLH